MKWCGIIGFADSVVVRPGVVKDGIVERKYRGDVLQDLHQWNSTENTTDDININNQISIVSDFYANHKLGRMKWIEFMGEKWKVKSARLNERRIIITIGDLYNGGD